MTCTELLSQQQQLMAVFSRAVDAPGDPVCNNCRPGEFAGLPCTRTTASQQHAFRVVPGVRWDPDNGVWSRHK